MESTAVHLIECVAGLNPVLQFLVVFAIGVVPYLESHVGAFVGHLTGVPVVLAALAAIVGNLLALAVRAGGAVRSRVASRLDDPSRRSQKVLARVDQFGVPVAHSCRVECAATPGVSTFTVPVPAADHDVRRPARG